MAYRATAGQTPRPSPARVRCGAVRCGAVRCGAVLCCVVLCGAVRCWAGLCWAGLGLLCWDVLGWAGLGWLSSELGGNKAGVLVGAGPGSIVGGISVKQLSLKGIAIRLLHGTHNKVVVHVILQSSGGIGSTTARLELRIMGLVHVQHRKSSGGTGVTTSTATAASRRLMVQTSRETSLVYHCLYTCLCTCLNTCLNAYLIACLNTQAVSPTSRQSSLVCINEYL